MMIKKNIFTISLYIVLLAVICSILLINYLRNKLGDGLIECAEVEVEKLATLVMNNCVHKYIDNNSIGGLLEIVRKSNNDIEMISYNVENVNKMTDNITRMLEDDLYYMSRGEFERLDINLNSIPKDYYFKLEKGVIFNISTGSATGNSLLANIGPKIPIKLSLVENTMVNIDNKITEYGINNVMMELYLNLQATIVIVMPFTSKKIYISRDIPLTMEIIQGVVPDYYLGNK